MNGACPEFNGNQARTWSKDALSKIIFLVRPQEKLGVGQSWSRNRADVLEQIVYEAVCRGVTAICGMFSEFHFHKHLHFRLVSFLRKARQSYGRILVWRIPRRL